METSREKFGFDDTDILLVTVGRLVGRKSIDQLIDIVADLNNSSLKLVVVGSGSLRGSLEARAKQKSVGSRVVFMGEVSEIDKQELLSLADLFVSTSQHEGFGLVYLEAMAAGLPVICYDRGGQTDFLDDKMTGYVVALNEKRTFIERCRELINSPERRTVMGDENKRRIETYYIDHCAYQYESLFESILRRNSGRGSKSLGL